MIDQGIQLAEAASGQNQYSGIIMMVMMFAVFYFLLIRPQQKRAKEHKALIEDLKTGDDVVTAGGIHGKVTALETDVLTVEVATGVKIKVNRSSIAATK